MVKLTLFAVKLTTESATAVHLSASSLRLVQCPANLLKSRQPIPLILRLLQSLGMTTLLNVPEDGPSWDAQLPYVGICMMAPNSRQITSTLLSLKTVVASRISPTTALKSSTTTKAHNTTTEILMVTLFKLLTGMMYPDITGWLTAQSLEKVKSHPTILPQVTLKNVMSTREYTTESNKPMLQVVMVDQPTSLMNLVSLN